jgi:hypothetical protein
MQTRIITQPQMMTGMSASGPMRDCTGACKYMSSVTDAGQQPILQGASTTG